MLPEVVVALIAAFASVIGSIATLLISLRTLRLEREKLETERGRFREESDRLQAEVGKIIAETEKLKAESDDGRRKRIEIEEAQLELEKRQVFNLYEKRNAIYPELLEVVYRLRNQLREAISDIEKEISAPSSDPFPFGPSELGQELYFLTENLYKYRAFIDKHTFDGLHQYKRLLQDAKVLLNRATRPMDFPEKSEDKEKRRKRLEEQKRLFLTRMQEAEEPLKAIYKEVDELYAEITLNIHKHVESVFVRVSQEAGTQ